VNDNLNNDDKSDKGFTTFIEQILDAHEDDDDLIFADPLCGKPPKNILDKIMKKGSGIQEPETVFKLSTDPET
jgi:hypothetical protein